MPVAPNEMTDSLASHPAVRAYLSQRGRMGYAKALASGKVRNRFTSQTAAEAARKQWTPERRAQQAAWMRRHNPRSRPVEE